MGTKAAWKEWSNLPIYVYRCEKCGSQVEKKQSFSDAPLVECELCHGHLHKVFSPAAIIYKGSGFYSTDYSSKSGSDGRNGSGEKSPGTEKNGGDKSESKAAAEPKGSTKDSSEVSSSASK